ncbi:MAG TPA: 50S ribosomal protein L35 [Candidatus Babeliales bacterium]|nr:50S ribosomal protein L35 [Candidatus Babeliales bacterium]
MAKMKTKSAAKKRLKKTKNSLFKGARAGRRHLLTKKSRSRKRKLRKALFVCPADRKSIQKLLPY